MRICDGRRNHLLRASRDRLNLYMDSNNEYRGEGREFMRKSAISNARKLGADRSMENPFCAAEEPLLFSSFEAQRASAIS